MDQLIGIFNQLVEFLKSDTMKSLSDAFKAAFASIKWDEVLATVKQLFEGAGSLINQ